MKTMKKYIVTRLDNSGRNILQYFDRRVDAEDYVNELVDSISVEMEENGTQVLDVCYVNHDDFRPCFGNYSMNGGILYIDETGRWSVIDIPITIGEFL